MYVLSDHLVHSHFHLTFALPSYSLGGGESRGHSVCPISPLLRGSILCLEISPCLGMAKAFLAVCPAQSVLSILPQTGNL